MQADKFHLGSFLGGIGVGFSSFFLKYNHVMRVTVQNPKERRAHKRTNWSCYDQPSQHIDWIEHGDCFSKQWSQRPPIVDEPFYPAGKLKFLLRKK